ncbi:MAG: sodium:proton antiporter NhaD [Gammaproteobacteria bacterium]|nr:sodium:proton antiporter NhaD [Gammaproteobacteria bacterium]
MSHLRALFALLLLFSPFPTLAASGEATLDLTNTGYGLIALILFVIAYALVIGEEFLHLRKSKPVIVAAGLIWFLVAIAYAVSGDTHTAAEAVRHNLLEYGELLLFLIAAMTYINVLEERNMFAALRTWLIASGYSLRTIFWLTGLLAFFISPVADNLTTALLMGAVAVAVGAGQPTFIVVSCISIVVAANAGGAFSPFGDITTLMVWQKGVVTFTEFFDLFLPSLINWLVPALFMSFAVPKTRPTAASEGVEIKKGGFVVLALFLLTITLAVTSHMFLHLPPVMGMMTGLGLLKLYGYRLRHHDKKPGNSYTTGPEVAGLQINLDDPEFQKHFKPRHRPFDIFISIKRVEWDTLMFFYGVILCVGGLGTIGYLALLSNTFYGELGPTWANILIGILSAIVDNIPVMYAVLTMNPEMSHGQWLLVTLTAGVGGSLLSIGSAAGVGLMGQARGIYTFFAHLKWAWAIALGYAASIWVHLWLNADLMNVYK